MAQHDYVIANGTGAAVRSDLNGALAAIVSNNSGATEPTPTYAYQWWPDTTTGNLKLRNGANNAWITIGPLATTGFGFLSSGGTLTAALGSASTPGITFTGDTNTGIYSPGADQVAISTNGTGRLFVDSSGRVGVGTSNASSYNADSNYLVVANGSSSAGITIRSATSSNCNIVFSNAEDSGVDGLIQYNHSNNSLRFDVNATERMRLTSTGLGIGSTPSYKLDVDGTMRSGSSGSPGSIILTTSGATEAGWMSVGPFNWHGGSDFAIGAGTSKALLLGSNNAERARIDTSGRLLVGTSSNATGSLAQIYQDNNLTSGTINVSTAGGLSLLSSSGTANYGSGIWFDHGSIRSGIAGSRATTASWGTDLRFYTHPDSTVSQFDIIERMRISSGGLVSIGTTNIDPAGANVVGCAIANESYISITRDNGVVIAVNRKTNDGSLIAFRQDGTDEGSISVSGTTVSYNGAHLSRWSQISGVDPHDKTDRPEILRGTVMSNLDEMCDWIEPESGEAQDNEQLNKTKISDVEGDKNVAGVFQSWDDDDDTWVNDYYLAMTGDFIVRIGAGVTVERGDLLMSAGDGTAKPQDDDLVRSCTIAKVTSTNVSCTYDDGSYCVPCVLMAC